MRARRTLATAGIVGTLLFYAADLACNSQCSAPILVHTTRDELNLSYKDTGDETRMAIATMREHDPVVLMLNLHRGAELLAARGLMPDELETPVYFSVAAIAHLEDKGICIIPPSQCSAALRELTVMRQLQGSVRSLEEHLVTTLALPEDAAVSTVPRDVSGIRFARALQGVVYGLEHAQAARPGSTPSTATLRLPHHPPKGLLLDTLLTVSLDPHRYLREETLRELDRTLRSMVEAHQALTWCKVRLLTPLDPWRLRLVRGQSHERQDTSNPEQLLDGLITRYRERSAQAAPGS